MAVRENNNPYRVGSYKHTQREAAITKKFWEDHDREQAMFASHEKLLASRQENSRLVSSGSPEETALVWLSFLATPLLVYVCVGRLSALPWWTYLAVPIFLSLLSQRIEAFGDAFVHFGKALIALIAAAALCQVVPLASRAVLAAILALAIGYSVFFMVSDRAEWLDHALGRFATCWYAAVILLVFFIVGCEIAAFWHVDSGPIEANAIHALKFSTGSIYDAVHEFWETIVG